MITSFFTPKSKVAKKNNDENDRNAKGISKRPRTAISHDENTLEQEVTKCQRLVLVDNTSTAAQMCPQVQEVLQYLHDPKDETNSNELITWRAALQPHTSSPSFRSLANFIAAQRESAPSNNRGIGAIYPPTHEVFSSLNLTPIHKVKVVIVGQDPYHQYNQGHGLSFSVKRGVQIPPSLRNMFKELLNDPKIDNVTSMPKHGYLERWAKQGVLMLNAVLTVRDSEPNSHADRGWEKFTDAVIQALDKFCDEEHKGLVFLLWGKPASKKAEGAIRQKKNHTIICTSHPSPLGATKTNAPFLGSRCFSRANEALVKMGLDPIDWNIDG